MNRKELRNYLVTLKKEELVKQILELEKKFIPVREYYQLKVTNDLSPLVNKFKQQIENEFFPSRGLPKMRISVARKAVTEAKKLGIPPDIMADLMLFYVETGVKFTVEFGDIDEPFYNSMESMYLSALKHLRKERLLPDFKSRAKKIIDDASDVGWGFPDTLANYFYDYY